MNSLRNRVQLIGNLGSDPEIKSFEKDRKMARINLAVNESYKDNDGKTIKETHWHNLVAWGKTAELAEKFLKKGKEVAVEGKLVTRSYEDKEGVKKYVTEVNVSEILFLGSNKEKE
ncbi:MAG: single-stranded DNA-binding protein [Bacteroidales bacterium]|nr:single-stranded DNA-binding protein [Bacteroidales bacterium]